MREFGLESRVAACPLQIRKSKLASFLAGPALDHDFRFGEKFDGVAALAVENAKETFFPSAKREVGHGSSNADVDADVSCGSFVAEFAGGRPAGGEERSLVAVRTAAEKVHRFIDGVGVNEAKHGPEDFGVSKLT